MDSPQPLGAPRYDADGVKLFVANSSLWRRTVIHRSHEFEERDQDLWTQLGQCVNAALAQERSGVPTPILELSLDHPSDRWVLNWVLDAREQDLSLIIGSIKTPTEDLTPQVPRLGAMISSGNNVRVYRATTEKWGEVVVKRHEFSLHGQLKDVSQCLTSALVHAKVEHRNVCRLYEVNFAKTENDMLLVSHVMESLDMDVATAIAEKTNLDVRQLLEETVAALSYAHAKDVAHRDLKPQNIFITRDGHFKIGAFGSVTTVSRDIVYMSPQQRGVSNGDCDEYNPFKGDTFSLGMTAISVASRTVIKTAWVLSFLRTQIGKAVKALKCQQYLKKLLLSMTAVEEEQRPTFTEIEKELARIVSQQRTVTNLPTNKQADRLRQQAEKTANTVQAEQTYKRALKLYAQLSPCQNYADCLYNLGTLYQKNQRVGEAEQTYERALQLYAQFPPCQECADCLNNLGLLYKDSQRVGEAEQTFERALQLYAQLPPCQNYATCLKNLGTLYQESKRVGEAELTYERALQLYAQLSPCQAYANCLKNLAVLYKESKRVGEAEQTYERALQLYAKLPPCQNYADCLNSLGLLYHRRRRVGEAEQTFERALQLYAQLPPCQDYATCLTNLAILYKKSQRVGEAEQTYERALQLYAQFPPCQGYATCLNNLGVLYDDVKRVGEAEQTYERALQLYAQFPPFQGYATCLNNLGNLYNRSKRVGKAEEPFERALQLYAQLPPCQDYANSLNNLRNLYADSTETQEQSHHADDRNQAALPFGL